MIRSVTSMFPADWRVVATVKRGGGKDRWGNVTPPTTHLVPDCLVGEATSDEVQQFSEVARLDAVLLGPVAADVKNTDVIDTPACAWAPARKWRVAGHVLHTPLGTKVPLTLEP